MVSRLYTTSRCRSCVALLIPAVFPPCQAWPVGDGVVHPMFFVSQKRARSFFSLFMIEIISEQIL